MWTAAECRCTRNRSRPSRGPTSETGLIEKKCVSSVTNGKISASLSRLVKRRPFVFKIDGEKIRLVHTRNNTVPQSFDMIGVHA